MSLEAPEISRSVIHMAQTLEVLPQELILVGGAVLALHGLRPTMDIDISVAPDVLPRVRERLHTSSRAGACDSLIEAVDIWEFGSGWGAWPHAMLQQQVSELHGIRHLDLAYVAYWKSLRERPKDRDDMWLILKHLTHLVATDAPSGTRQMSAAVHLLARNSLATAIRPFV